MAVKVIQEEESMREVIHVRMAFHSVDDRQDKKDLLF